jgi:hypothetical protein
MASVLPSSDEGTLAARIIGTFTEDASLKASSKVASFKEASGSSMASSFEAFELQGSLVGKACHRMLEGLDKGWVERTS